MIGYVLPGASPATAKVDPRMRRLASAGPWQFQMHPQGAVAVWVNESGPVPFGEFKHSRQTIDGMTYLRTDKLPLPMELVKPNIVMRTDLHKLNVDTPVGQVMLPILPAYCTPRVILEDNTLGDFSTVYARNALVLLGKLAETTEVVPEDIGPLLFDVCRDAIMTTTRSTPELIADCGWINEDSCWEIWKAVTHVPKASLKSESAPSGCSSPPAVSIT